MASFTNQIKVLVEFVSDKATSAAKSFRTEVAKADGVAGKFKAGIGSLNQTIGNALRNPAVLGASVSAAGVAMIQSADAAATLALDVGKLSDATGLALDPASRLAEVAGDIGVSTGTLEKSIGFMNKTLGKTPGLFGDLGIEIAKANGGTTDVNGTFLNVIDRLNRIEDPAQRAAAATQVLGRGWMEMAELIELGADDVKTAMGEVSDAKIIDEDKLSDARTYRAAMDDLGDAFGDIALTVGSDLVPVLATAADLIAKIVGISGVEKIIDPLPDDKAIRSVEDLRDEIEALGLDFSEIRIEVTMEGRSLASVEAEIAAARKELTGFSSDADLAGASAVLMGERSRSAGRATRDAEERLRELGDAARHMGERSREAADGLDEEREASDKVTDALKDQIKAQEDLIGLKRSAIDKEYALREAVEDSDDAVADYNETMADTKATEDDRADATESARKAAVDMSEAFVDTKGAALDSREGVRLQIEKLQEFLGTVEPGSPLYLAIAEYIALLESIPTSVSTNVNISGNAAGARFGARAAGGPVQAGVPYIVGENRPELFVPNQSGRIIPRVPQQNITRITMPAAQAESAAASDEVDDLELARRQFERRMIDEKAYLKILESKRRGLKVNSDEEYRIYQEIERVKADSVAAAAAADQEKQERLAAMARWEYDTGKKSAEDYIKFLAIRRAGLVAFTQEWLQADAEIRALQQRLITDQAMAERKLWDAGERERAGRKAEVDLDKALADWQSAQADRDAVFADRKAKDEDRSRASEQVSRAYQRVVDQALSGVEIQAVRHGLEEGTQEWADFIQAQVRTWTSNHQAFADPMNAYLSTFKNPAGRVALGAGPVFNINVEAKGLAALGARGDPLLARQIVEQLQYHIRLNGTGWMNPK